MIEVHFSSTGPEAQNYYTALFISHSQTSSRTPGRTAPRRSCPPDEPLCLKRRAESREDRGAEGRRTCLKKQNRPSREERALCAPASGPATCWVTD
ncbi:hypothetical protein SKAU_G00083740 [Synaphobranchus kaupii]|uniref:Uncharacterized protein n=1 Tax=Synaphobranchus kaupii TaxID=118154 RepID=A0A9Q1FW76_SYNKA|nr:hypothetical protein SKAU_G00083740 [Synaphobranchus kaupii]